MGVSNIRYANDLLGKAGRGQWDEVALIPEPLMKCIYIDARSIPAAELQEHAHILIMPESEYGRWRPLMPALSDVSTAPTPTPKATLTPGLGKFWRSNLNRPFGQPSRQEPEEPEEPEGLVFVAVVQGLAGSAKSKTIKRYSQRDIARAIYHELITGFSIVFTGAFLATALKMNRHVQVEWHKGDSMEQLRAIDVSNDEPGASTGRKIGIIC